MMNKRRKHRLLKSAWERAMSKLERQIERKSARLLQLLAEYEKLFGTKQETTSERPEA